MFTPIEAKAHHCGQMVRSLRAEHQQAVAALGINAHRDLRDRFMQSTIRRAWSLDGKLAGLLGVTGSALSAQGLIWLAITDEAAKHPVAVLRECRRTIDEIMIVKRELFTTLIPDDKTALRFAMYLGFEVAHTTPIPVGRGHVIAVRYAKIRDAA